MRTAGTAVAGGQRNRFKGKRGGSLAPSITMMLMNLFYILSPFMYIYTFTVAYKTGICLSLFESSNFSIC